MSLPGFFVSSIVAQDPETPQYRSRAELLAARRDLEKTFPEVVRALRTLRLPADKMDEARIKLRQADATTRAARQELQTLEAENNQQGCGPRSTTSKRADELRASLQQSSDQLQSEIKPLLNPKQREQFERQLAKRVRDRGSKSNKRR